MEQLGQGAPVEQLGRVAWVEQLGQAGQVEQLGRAALEGIRRVLNCSTVLGMWASPVHIPIPG